MYVCPMVVLNPTRMRSITDAKTKLNALVSEAQTGQTTHIVSGANVVAHLVPPTARIIDDELVMRSMRLALTRQEVEWMVEEAQRAGGELYSAGDVMGRLLGWAWRTDADLFMRTAVDYTLRLAEALDRSIPLVEIRPPIRRSLGAILTDGEVTAADVYLARNWEGWMPGAS